MKIEIHETVWLDERHEFSFAELVERSGLPECELHLLVDCAVLAPVDPSAGEARFGAECLAAACMAQRLRNDFDLESTGLALSMTLLNRVHELEARLRALNAQTAMREK